ncbi:YD repeat-containing protein [Flavobacterium arsenatis]|uniref:YD repeat-containing protein n=1 Tax=Flavobacterium arsenatis TaxID=1484332 RepID=A0ABU1TTA2_9FLAO|nr:hypothetical protein [Flavobacterium arsenatis]MDR6969108.1 YD repeat-containing protein [Flavobacterium arsenatis]
MKTTLYFFLMLVILSNVAAQQQQQLNLPTIIPASPTSQTFMRYGEIPVDYSTGVPNIDIPIYTLEGTKLKVPISISYHASGIKVQDIASEVGLGWSLNAGGMISRTVNGIRDEKSIAKTYSNAAAMLAAVNTNAHIYDCASNVLSGIRNFEFFFDDTFDNTQDSMSDRYFYRLPNGPSGVFTYDYPANNTAITLPYRPYKIERFIDPSGQKKIYRFKITDDNGTLYTFESYMSSTQPPSEWFLKEMVSADGTDTITFTYQLREAAYSRNAVSKIYFSSPQVYSLQCSPSDLFSGAYQTLTPLPGYNTPVLQSITSSKAVVTFEYQDDREDFPLLKRLSGIKVTPVGVPSQIIKSVIFNDRYFGTTAENKRLGLENVTFAIPGVPEQQKYNFTYEAQVLPAYPYKMSLPKYQEDFWGYYNGTPLGSANNKAPRDFITNANDKQNYGADRKADSSPTGYYSKACMLKEISYPTGGRTVFEFERAFINNLYPYNAPYSNGYAGGFRVASIKSFTEADVIAGIKTYQYNIASTRQLRQEYYTYNQFMTEKRYTGGSEFPNNHCWAEFSKYYVFPDPILPLEVAPGLQVVYKQVTEYHGTLAGHESKTVYEYDYPYSPNEYDDSPLEYQYERFHHPFHYDKGNYLPQLLSKETSLKNLSGYNKVQREEYQYKELFKSTFNTGIKLTRQKSYQHESYWTMANAAPYGCCGYNENCVPGCNPDAFCSSSIDEYINSIVAIDTKAYQEASVMTQSMTFVYDPQDETKFVLTTRNLTYNQANLAVKEETSTSSEGDLLKTEYKYPHDFPTVQPYQAMLARNQIAQVIEANHYRGAVLQDKVLTRYRNWGSGIIEPEYVSTQKAGIGGVENRVDYLAYTQKANLAGVRKTDGTPTAYLWGYSGTLPIAMVDNSRYVNTSVPKTLSQHFSTNNSSISMTSSVPYTLASNCVSNCTAGTAINAMVTRRYQKGNDHPATFTVKIYGPGNTLAATITDNMLQSQTTLEVSSQVSLPPGAYTATAAATYPVGFGYGTTYSQEVEVELYATFNVDATVPFHTSFEEDAQQVSTSQSKTGTKSHTGSYTLTIPSSSSGYSQMVVSFWGKISAFSAWTYVEQTVTTTTSGSTVTIGGGYAFIDEVRLHPPGAQMSTYTYKPLVGITSMTDPKGLTTTYEYDAFGRLKCVRDHQGNILTESKYHYKPQN